MIGNMSLASRGKVTSCAAKQKTHGRQHPKVSRGASTARQLNAARASSAEAPPSSSRIEGTRYHVTQEDIEKFHRDGYVTLRGVMTEEEMAAVIDPTYYSFVRGEIPVPGGDLCDMSGAKGRSPGEFTVYNVMLPRRYRPEWQGNLFEQRCQSIADQLCAGDMAIDYDQILAKRPHSPDSIFAWHQDMAYWPDFRTDNRTATCWLAVTDSTAQNGCVRFIPGSHAEPEIRLHSPVGATRKDSHALFTVVDEDKENVVMATLKRGDITVHNERVVHGSGPNTTDGWRNGYVLAFRKAETVAKERAIGFSHSHNDVVSWDVFHEHMKMDGGPAMKSAE